MVDRAQSISDDVHAVKNYVIKRRNARAARLRVPEPFDHKRNRFCATSIAADTAYSIHLRT